MLTAFLTMVLPALLPAATDGVRAVINKFTGGAGAMPSSPEQVIAMSDADTRRLEALAKLDNVGQVSTWVNNLRALQRPCVGLLVLAGAFAAMAMALPEAPDLVILARGYVFYLFGDRTYMHLTRRG